MDDSRWSLLRTTLDGVEESLLTAGLQVAGLVSLFVETAATVDPE